jgi:hypothetical protein
MGELKYGLILAHKRQLECAFVNIERIQHTVYFCVQEEVYLKIINIRDSVYEAACFH